MKEGQGRESITGQHRLNEIRPICLNEITWEGNWAKSIRYLKEDIHVAGLLDGKVVLITGGGSGIGRTTAIRVAREGGMYPRERSRPSR